MYSGAGPGYDIALDIRHGNDRVVEGSPDMDLSMFNIFFLLLLFLCLSHFLCCTGFINLFLTCHRKASGPLPGSGIGFGALTPDRHMSTMSKPAIVTKIHQSLN